METGPAFINNATPKDFEKQGWDRGENFYEIISNYINDLKITPSYVLKNFHEVVNHTKLGGVSNSHSFEAIPEVPFTYLLDMSASEIGPVLLTENFFFKTINDYQGHGLRRLYYMPIKGYDDVVILASLDVYFMPKPYLSYWVKKIVHDVWGTLPVVIILSLLLGWFVSRWTVAPVLHIARVAKRLGEQDLDERVQTKSKDEIGSLANSLNRMADKIQAAFTAQKRFISDAAHELKTPLASMKTSVTGALDGEKTSEEYRYLLSFLSERIDTQERLIDNLLFLARADEYHLNIEKKTVNLSEVISEATEAYAYLFEEKRVILKNVSESDIMITADSKLLFRLLSNLLDNAFKHTPTGGQVMIFAKKLDTDVVIEIQDTGTGIPSECLDFIFERFYKTSDTGASGFGLGLAICKSIVESHGGKISVTSQLGTGTTFLIKLPLNNFS
ncbi:MAG: HAMP domain-containing histidine kinase [Dehalococcoidales bacterium]|nr:HAMP domain-containing histidine kinase [Dehalococcoidales bacterium]